MASSSASASASSSKHASLQLTKYTVSKGVLQYTTTQTELTQNIISTDAWTTLEVGKRGKGDSNVGTIVFDGSISITQYGHGCEYTLTLSQAQYKLWGISKMDDDTVRLVIKPFGTMIPTLTGDAAEDLPLAKSCNDFAYLLLKMGVADMKRAKGKSPSHAEEAVAQIRGDYEALKAETKAREQLGFVEGAQIKTRAGKANRTVVVEVFLSPPKDPENPLEVKDYDFSKKLGQSYWLKAPGLFPDDEDSLDAHPILGAYITEGWELVIAKGQDDNEGSFVGTIRNILGDSPVIDFIGEESNVSLEPIANDILGMRSRKAVGKVTTQIDEYSRQVTGFFQPDDEAKPRSLLPVEPLFFDEECDETKNALPDVVEIPAEIARDLNSSQLLALEKALGKKVSIVFGPPGSGKSYVVSTVTKILLREPAEKLVSVAATNVAVDALLKSCVKTWWKYGGNGVAPFVRVYSEAQIQSQWQNDELSTLENEYHIDALRYRLAYGSSSYVGYHEGREEMRKYGTIINEDQHQAYREDVKELNKLVLSNVTAVFCTITACQTPVLYDEDPVDGEIRGTFPATTIIIDEAGVILRPQMVVPIMTFKTAKRLILAGDPLQLTALILAKISERWWPSSFLQQLIDRKCTYTFLDIQYRMHDVLYAHLVKVIYPKPIASAYKTRNPSPSLQRLQGTFPLTVDTGGDMYTVNSFIQFLDVPEGAKARARGGSSWNAAEVEVVSGLVKALIAAGIPRRTIAVMTGYSEQKRQLLRRAKQDSWDDICQIMTIDSSQGDEYEVVILSLVTTDQTAGFMGKRPRACVGTSRQKEAIYFVGNAKFWFGKEKSGWKWTHEILKAIKNNPDLPAPFIVESQFRAPFQVTVAAHPNVTYATPAAPAPVASGEATAFDRDQPEETPAEKLAAFIEERKSVEADMVEGVETKKQEFVAGQELAKVEYYAALDRDLQELKADNQGHEDALRLAVDFNNSLD